MKEKKEIGKLLELLNEYRTEKLRREMYVNGADKEAIKLSEAERINEYEVSQTLDSQNYLKSFVKWLVENEKVNPYDPSYNVPTHIALGVDDGDGDFMVYERFFKEEELLMLLSIQDEPIKFLISILK